MAFSSLPKSQDVRVQTSITPGRNPTRRRHTLAGRSNCPVELGVTTFAIPSRPRLTSEPIRAPEPCPCSSKGGQARSHWGSKCCPSWHARFRTNEPQGPISLSSPTFHLCEVSLGRHLELRKNGKLLLLSSLIGTWMALNASLKYNEKGFSCSIAWHYSIHTEEALDF